MPSRRFIPLITLLSFAWFAVVALRERAAALAGGQGAQLIAGHLAWLLGLAALGWWLLRQGSLMERERRENEGRVESERDGRLRAENELSALKVFEALLA